MEKSKNLLKFLMKKKEIEDVIQSNPRKTLSPTI